LVLRFFFLQKLTDAPALPHLSSIQRPRFWDALDDDDFSPLPSVSPSRAIPTLPICDVEKSCLPARRKKLL
jgi:hypothetical protein